MMLRAAPRRDDDVAAVVLAEDQRLQPRLAAAPPGRREDQDRRAVPPPVADLAVRLEVAPHVLGAVEVAHPGTVIGGRRRPSQRVSWTCTASPSPRSPVPRSPPLPTSAAAHTDADPLSVTAVEPLVGGKVVVERVAAGDAGQDERWRLNLDVWVRNSGSSAATLKRIAVGYPGAPVTTTETSYGLTIAAGEVGKDPGPGEPRAAVPGRAVDLRPARVRPADAVRQPCAGRASQPGGRRRLSVPGQARRPPRRLVLDRRAEPRHRVEPPLLVVAALRLRLRRPPLGRQAAGRAGRPARAGSATRTA